MTIVRRPSPLGEFMTLRQAMDRFFDDDMFRPLRWTSGAYEGPGLPLDVTTTPDEFVVQASLPGIKPEDVEITVENGMLSLRIPKAEQVKPRQIRISPVSEATATRTAEVPAEASTA